MNWIKIPVTDLNRSKEFYSKIFEDITFQDMETKFSKFSIFSTFNNYNIGVLMQMNGLQDNFTKDTAMIMGRKDEMNHLLRRVQLAGGKIIMPKTFVGDVSGHVCIFIDPDGNTIGVKAN